MKRFVIAIGIATTAVAVSTQCSTQRPTATTTVTVTSEKTVTASATAKPTNGIDRADVEPWLGEWTGSIDQPSSSTPYSVRMHLAHDGQTVVGTVAYPELKCNGTLGDARFSGGVLSIVETITNGGRCVSPVDLELTLKPGTVQYHFDSSGGGNGTLRRG